LPHEADAEQRSEQEAKQCPDDEDQDDHVSLSLGPMSYC
jgi:hypothetical protein